MIAELGRRHHGVTARCRRTTSHAWSWSDCSGYATVRIGSSLSDPHLAC